MIPAFLFFFTLFFYLRTHCASFNINDSGETIMVCDLLTISHSPGYPLHTLWGRVSCLLPLGQPMLRVTFNSMITATAAVVVVYWVLKMFFKEIFDNPETAGSVPEDQKCGPWLWEIPSLFGALTFAFSYQQWFQACGAKGGIYTLNTLLSVCMLFLFFKMRENGWFVKSFLLMGFLYGLSLAHHWPNQVVMAPAYLWFFLASQKRVPLASFLRNAVRLRPFDLWENFRNVISAFGVLNVIRAFTCMLLSVSIYSYLPIRATQSPLVNWWNPQTFDTLVGTVLRKGYQGVGDVRNWTTKLRVLKRFWLHAHDQFGDVFTYVLIIVGLWGFIWLLRRKHQWPTTLGFSFFGGGVFMGILLFNNPLEGYQWTIDNFFTPVFLTVCIFAAAGVAGMCEWVAEEWPLKQVPLYASAFCLSFALVPLILNYKANDQSRYVSSYDEGVNMLKTVNDDAVIVCNGDIDILPLWYLQFVEGKRPKVVSFTMQLIPYDWYREPLFERWPFLKVPVGQDIRPETVVQNMIETHAPDRSFYFTNIFTAPWMREKNPSLPEGFLWRMTQTKKMNYDFTSGRLNALWDTYRLRYMDEPDRGYWDEYTDVMKDSYGIGYDFTGYFALMNKMPDIAVWSFGNALKFRQPQTLSRIYMMLAESYLALGDTTGAINNYQETLRREPGNSYAYAKLGDAYFASKDYQDSESSYRTALGINPQETDATNGLLILSNPQEGIKRFEEALKSDPIKNDPKNAAQIPYLYGKIGDADLILKNYKAAEKNYKAAYSLNSCQPEAVNGLKVLKEAHN